MFCHYVAANQRQLHKGIFHFLVGKYNKAGEYVTMCFGKNYSVYVISRSLLFSYHEKIFEFCCWITYPQFKNLLFNAFSNSLGLTVFGLQ